MTELKNKKVIQHLLAIKARDAITEDLDCEINELKDVLLVDSPPEIDELKKILSRHHKLQKEFLNDVEKALNIMEVKK